MQRSAPGRPQASPAGIHPRGYHRHPVYLRRRVCGVGENECTCPQDCPINNSICSKEGEFFTNKCCNNLVKIPEKDGLFEIFYNKKANDDAVQYKITELLNKLCLSNVEIFETTIPKKNSETPIKNKLFAEFSIPPLKLDYEFEPNCSKFYSILSFISTNFKSALQTVEQSTISYPFSLQYPKIFYDSARQLFSLNSENTDKQFEEVINHFILASYAPLHAFNVMMIRANIINNINKADITPSLIKDISQNLSNILLTIKHVHDQLSFYFQNQINIGIFSLNIEQFRQATIQKANIVLMKPEECKQLI